MKKSLDCMCLLRHLIFHRIHVGVLLLLHVHACLLCPVYLHVFAPFLHLLLCLLLLHMRAPHPCMMHTIRGRTRVGLLKGPTGTKRVKGGVSGPVEDLRPVTEVEAGVNFRPVGRVRGQVAGSLPGRQPGTGTRTGKGSVVTPSLHPEVPDSLSVSPGPGKRIRRTIGDLGAKG